MIPTVSHRAACSIGQANLVYSRAGAVQMLHEETTERRQRRHKELDWLSLLIVCCLELNPLAARQVLSDGVTVIVDGGGVIDGGDVDGDDHRIAGQRCLLGQPVSNAEIVERAADTVGCRLK